MRRVLALLLIYTITACTYVPKMQTPPLPRASSTREAFDGFQGAASTSGVTLLSSNADAWAARWEMLENAERSVDSSYFILRNDLFGLAFLGHLYVRAREGVKVRVLIDGRGSGDLATPLLGRDWLQELVDSGPAEVRIFNPPLGNIARSLAEAKLTPVAAGTHNKILVVDKQIALTGGRNVASMYFTQFSEDEGAVNDADVILDGPAVDALTTAFEKEWSAPSDVRPVSPDPINLRSQRALLVMMYAAMDAWLHARVEPGDVFALERAAVAALPSRPAARVRNELRPRLEELAQLRSIYGVLPLKNERRHDAEVRVISAVGVAVAEDDSANAALLTAIAGAKRDIIIQSPYLILTPRIVKALVRAGARGVNISILTNSPISSDNVFAQALFIDTWPELEARIRTLRVFVEPTAQMQHAKRVVVDDELTLIGTYNLDPFSAHLNSEMFVAAWSRELNAQARSEMVAKAEHMLEYRIVRDARGHPRRHPAGHPLAGQPVVSFGPKNHVDNGEIARLRALKGVLISIRGAWDFEVVVW